MCAVTAIRSGALAAKKKACPPIGPRANIPIQDGPGFPPGNDHRAGLAMSIRLTIVLSVAAYVMSLAVAGAQPQPRPPGQPKGSPGGAPSQSGGIITSTTPEMTVRLLGEAGYEDVK